MRVTLRAIWSGRRSLPDQALVANTEISQPTRWWRHVPPASLLAIVRNARPRYVGIEITGNARVGGRQLAHRYFPSLAGGNVRGYVAWTFRILLRSVARKALGPPLWERLEARYVSDIAAYETMPRSSVSIIEIRSGKKYNEAVAFNEDVAGCRYRLAVLSAPAQEGALFMSTAILGARLARRPKASVTSAANATIRHPKSIAAARKLPRPTSFPTDQTLARQISSRPKWHRATTPACQQ